MAENPSSFWFKSPVTHADKNFEAIRPGHIPSTPILWPFQQHRGNQIQQTKGSATPLSTNSVPTTLPTQSPVLPRTTPATVSNVRLVTRPGTNGQRNVTVQFVHPHGDPYFAGANVYLKKAGQPPTLVASGAKSPLTFTAPASAAPHSVYVTSVGNWGETKVDVSPSAPLMLSNAAI